MKACAYIRLQDSNAAQSALNELGAATVETPAEAELKLGLLKVVLHDAFDSHDQQSAVTALHEYCKNDTNSGTVYEANCASKSAY